MRVAKETSGKTAAAQPLGVTIHNHLVVGQGRYVSFKEFGLL